MRLYAPATVDQVVDALLSQPDIAAAVVADERRPARPAEAVPLPAWLEPRLRDGLARDGLTSLYSHQAAALEALHDGHDVMVVTPTASGKSLCYHLPVLQAVADDPAARALYLFPTKALSQDQLVALRAPGDRRRGGAGRRGLRRRHARPDPLHHPHRRPGRGHQPGHAPRGDPAAPHEVVPALRTAALRRGRRGAHLSGRLRQPRRQRPAPAPPPVRPLRQPPPADPAARPPSATPATWRRRSPAARSRSSTATAPRPARRRVVLLNPPVVDATLGVRREHLRPGRADRPGLPARRAPDDRLRPLPHRRGAPPDAPARGAPRGPRAARAAARLPRRLPALRAPRHRVRPARCLRPGGRQHQRPGARPRHRTARRGGAGRLPRHRRRHVAADGPGGSPPGAVASR